MNDKTNDDTAERRIAAAPEAFGISAEDAELYLLPIAHDPDRVNEVATSLAKLRYEQNPDTNKPNPAQGNRHADAGTSAEQAFVAFMGGDF